MDSSPTHSKFYRNFLFLRTWLKSPGRVGAVIPSSDFLAKRIAQIVKQQHGAVIELGAGTGALTNAILNSGVQPQNLYVVEIDPHLCDVLGKRFPGINIINADACKLKKVLLQHDLKITDIGCVVSSLPLLSLPNGLKHRILLQIFKSLPGGSPLIQYTYGPRSPVPKKMLEKFGRSGKRVDMIIRNVPPATIWTF